MIDTKITGTDAFYWKNNRAGVLLSEPAFSTSGYDMHFAIIPKDGQLTLPKDIEERAIVNLLRGNTAYDALRRPGQATTMNNQSIQAEENTLLFLAINRNPDGTACAPIISPSNIGWKEMAPGIFRTDPKVGIDDYQVNLWYINPNTNGGIHNHAEDFGHNPAVQFIEFHTQLRGNGEMVIYGKNDPNAVKHRIPMSIGNTHPLMSTIKDGRVSYPWHAYVSGDQGALFIAFEDYRIPK